MDVYYNYNSAVSKIGVNIQSSLYCTYFIIGYIASAINIKLNDDIINMVKNSHIGELISIGEGHTFFYI